MPRRLRFCHISTFYPPYSFGGDAVYLYRLANSLAGQGHEVDVIHCADSYNLLAGKHALEPLPHHPGVAVHNLHSRLGPVSPFLSQQTGWPLLKAGKIRRILESKAFDVIHYHNTSLFGPKVLEIKPDYPGFIKLYTTHEHWLICPMHVLWKDNDRLCDRPQCFICTLRFCRPPQWWRYTNMLRKAAEHIDVFISPSRFAVDMHFQRGFRKPFAQLPYFSPAPDSETDTSSDSANTRPYFLFVGRLEKIKGLQNVIPVFRGYKQADLLVAGKGSYEPQLRRLALGLENVVFLGWVPPKRLAALYRSAVALIVPSICYEVFPLVLLDAFPNGTAAIVNAVGVLPEIVQDCQCGITYRNEAELLGAMEQLHRDRELRHQLGSNAYQKWEQQWTEAAHLQGYFNILTKTAQRKYGFVPWAEAGDDIYFPSQGTQTPLLPAGHDDSGSPDEAT